MKLFYFRHVFTFQPFPFVIKATVSTWLNTTGWMSLLFCRLWEQVYSLFRVWAVYGNISLIHALDYSNNILGLKLTLSLSTNTSILSPWWDSIVSNIFCTNSISIASPLRDRLYSPNFPWWTKFCHGKRHPAQLSLDAFFVFILRTYSYFTAP